MDWLSVLLQQIINGLSIGMIYALVALGYTMVYGILQLINFAHGEIFMVGSYLGLTVLLIFGITTGTLATPVLIAILCLMFLAATSGASLLGITIERMAYRPLREAGRLAPLITAIGVSFFLQNAVMLIYGPQNQPFPSVIRVVSFQIGHATITNFQILIFAVSIFFMITLTLFIKFTRMGKAMRATADDRVAALLMGINPNRTIMWAFLIGSFLAAIGGTLFGMYYGTINFHDGYLVGLKAFTAAVLGGIGNIPGAMLGGLLIGLVEGLGAGYISSEWKNVFAFVILILVLLIKPSGLLGERMPERD